MNVKEFYASINGDYEGVMGRLHDDAIAKRFILKFTDDPCFHKLAEAMAISDREAAFNAVHTLKGVCLNLGFSRLESSCSALTEALRTEPAPEAPALFDAVKTDYANTVSAIKLLESSDAR